jgi:hypothetical protein
MTTDDGGDRDELTLSLLRAPDDPAQFSLDHQAELKVIYKDLRRRGLRVNAIAAHPGDDTYLGVFRIVLDPSATTAIAAIAIAWMLARNGRKVRLNFAGVEAEGRTYEELIHFLRRASELKKIRRNVSVVRS